MKKSTVHAEDSTAKLNFPILKLTPEGHIVWCSATLLSLLISYNMVSSYLLLSYLMSYHLIPSSLISSRLIYSYFTFPHVISSNPISSRLILSHPISFNWISPLVWPLPLGGCPSQMLFLASPRHLQRSQLLPVHPLSDHAPLRRKLEKVKWTIVKAG